jgi:hypothetical protein
VRTKPAGTQIQRRGRNQNILNGGTAVLEQIRQLSIMYPTGITTHHDRRRRFAQHLPIRHTVRHSAKRRLVMYDNKMPGIFSTCRRRRHGGLEQILKNHRRNIGVFIPTNATTLKNNLKFGIHIDLLEMISTLANQPPSINPA